MFSFNPLPVTDTLNSHGGFWFLLWIIGGINLIWFLFSMDAKNYKSFLLVFVLSATLMNFVGYKSWTTGQIIVPKNEKVIGTLSGFIAEGEAYTERSGKRTVRRENHYLYVAYTVEGFGRVIFPANKGITYPERAILYKN